MPGRTPPRSPPVAAPTGRAPARGHSPDDLEARWSAAWSAVGATDPAPVFESVVAAYREPHRAYHDLEHLRDCLWHLDRAAEVAERRDEVELALWFHDVVYKPLSSKNEEASARFATRALRAAGADDAAVERIAAMVLDTRHRSPPGTTDGRLVADVDLAILGAAPHAYERYEAAIRREFSWVPGEAFRRRRAEVLQRFLDRDRIYHTEPFRDRYEEPARTNLRRSIARLRA